MIGNKKRKSEISKDLFHVGKKEKIIMFSFFCMFTLIMCVPVYSLIRSSLKVNGLDNYVYVLKNNINDVPFYKYFINSGINAVGSSTLVAFVCICAGYAFSKVKFLGRTKIFNLLLMFMAISGPVLIIPFFYILKNLQLFNSHLGIILCEVTITIPFGTLMTKSFFDRLPNELMEAANIDGSSTMQTFFQIYLPLAKPVILNLGVLQFMWSLQDFLFPLMFLVDDNLYTATVAVNSFQGAYGMSPQDLGRYNAALVLIAIPSILIFIISQKYIIDGVVSGSTKA